MIGLGSSRDISKTLISGGDLSRNMNVASIVVGGDLFLSGGVPERFLGTGTLSLVHLH